VHYESQQCIDSGRQCASFFFRGISGLDACESSLEGFAQFIELSRLGGNPRFARLSANSREFNKFRCRPLALDPQAYNPHVCLWNGAMAVEAQKVSVRSTCPVFNPVHMQTLLCGSIK
jgi:hypothetical protein